MFLYPDVYAPRPDDVVAHHFIKGLDAYSRWLESRGPLSPSLVNAKKRADKELAHLTAKRVYGRPPAKEWDMPGLAQELKELLTQFVLAADPATDSDKLRAAIG